MNQQLPPEVVAALRAGNPIEAIKAMRKANPKMGLADAKRFLEEVQKLAPRPPSATTSSGPAAKSPGASSARGSVPHTPKSVDVASTFERTGLSPGEVPRASAGGGALALMIVAVLAILLYMRFG